MSMPNQLFASFIHPLNRRRYWLYRDVHGKLWNTEISNNSTRVDRYSDEAQLREVAEKYGGTVELYEQKRSKGFKPLYRFSPGFLNRLILRFKLGREGKEATRRLREIERNSDPIL